MNSKAKKLLNSNNELDKKINAENQAVFTDMICYIRSANISDYNQEVIRQDLSEMIVSAQERGEDIDSVIGGDFKEFCDEVIKNFPAKTLREKVCYELDIFCSCMAVLGVINIIFSKDLYRVIEGMLSEKAVNYNIGISLGMIISTAAILIAAELIVNITLRTALKKSSSLNKWNRIVIGGIIGAGIMALFIFIVKFGEQVVFSIHIFLAILSIIIFFFVHKMLS